LSQPIQHLAIIAGGRGTRMGEAYANLPKALIPVGGKPVLQHQLELARGAGVTGVTIFAGHLADQIEAFVGDGSRFGLAIGVHVEPEPLGNAGALVAALDDLPEQFFVLYGDVMPAVDLAALGAFHLDHAADFTALAHPNDHPHDSDLLEADSDGRVIAIHAYPHPEGAWFANLTNAACYAVRREALKPFAKNVETAGKLDFTKDVMTGLIARGDRVLAWRSADYIKDMGSPERLRRVDADWRAGKITTAALPRPAVFLDRDGVLNHERSFIRRPDQLELIAGVPAALKQLREAGFRLIVITNQSVIARGDATEVDVARIHAKLEWELGKGGAFVDAIYLCPHHPDGGFPGERPDLKVVCDCRKPATGLIERACADFAIDRPASWMVGDQARDIEMAHRAGLRSILVRSDPATFEKAAAAQPDQITADLAAAAALIAPVAMVAA
jgi:histidinol-phosphate phosphatase family protein